MTLYLLRRRGIDGPSDRAMIVRARSEAHARVAAYGRSHDMAWTDDQSSTCDEIARGDGVLHTVYAAPGLDDKQ